MSGAPLLIVSITKESNRSKMSTPSNNVLRESEFSKSSSIVSDVSRSISVHSAPSSVSSAPASVRNSTGSNLYNTAIERTAFSRRNFYQACNMKDASELGTRVDGEAGGLGTKGTFRAKAIARRFNNNSRRNLLKQSQGISVKSILSNITIDYSEHSTGIHSERIPLNRGNSDIPEDERVTSFGLKSDNSSEPYGTTSGSIASIKEISEKKEENIWINFVLIWIGKPVCILLLFFPFALAAHYLNWGPQWIFWLNFLVMVPLASILGDFTEEAALHTNDVVGGLLNASFGNAVEVVVAFNALMNNEIRVVQASMIGSIFSNLLLVLGCCFLFGGFRYTEQKFHSMNATTSLGLLALSSIALILPTPFAEYYEIENADVLIISRASACFMLFSYMQLLYFQLFSHRDMFESKVNENDEENREIGIDEEEEATVPMWMALTGLFITTGLVTIFSNFLVDSIAGFCNDSGISRTFVGLIILPIVGNAIEHITAVSVAMKNKMDLAIGVAVGSCTQIALFVVPVTVIFGWCVDKDMTLNYPPFEIQLYILSIFMVSVVLSAGKSNWLLGSVLVITYFMVAIGFWFEKLDDF